MIVGVVRYWDLGRGKAKGKFAVRAKDDKEFNDILEKEFGRHLVSSNIGFSQIQETFMQVFILLENLNLSPKS